MNVAELKGLSLAPVASPAAEVAAEAPLEQRVAEATIRWMRELNASEAQGRSEFSVNKQLVRKGIWYPNNYRNAVNSLGQTAAEIKKFVEDKNGYICGYAPVKYFESIADKSEYSYKGKRMLHFVLKKGALPSEAIRAAKVGLSMIDCGMALQIARYGALLEVLGERKFNILFGDSAKGHKMNIGFLVDDDLQPMKHFVNFTDPSIEYGTRNEMISRGSEVKQSPKIIGKPGDRSIKVGQSVEIKGISTHRLKHPWDPAAGYNLVCSDDTPGQQRFIGLGIEGSEAEINEHLVHEYNKHFNPNDLLPELKNKENIAYAEKYKNHEVKSLNPKKGEGLNPESMQDFHISLIKDLIDLPESQVSMDYVRRHPSQDELSVNNRIIDKIESEEQKA